MPVSVKEYLDSMKSVGSSQKKAATGSNDLKTQLLLSQLIEAISYANSIDFRKATLNKTAPGETQGGLTGKQVLENVKAQEKLIAQLAEGQKLSQKQNKELSEAIDKFYNLAGAQEINYKKFAANLEKFALQDLPEAVQNRLINDSRDAHMIGKEQKDKAGVILPVLKRIRNLLEDSAEVTKQFNKKFFVTLDQFREGLLNAFDNFKNSLSEGGSIFSKVLDTITMLGAGWMALRGQFQEGNFKFGQGIKQFDSIKTAIKAIKEFGGLGKTLTGQFKGLKSVVQGFKDLGGAIKGFMQLPKEMKTFQNAFGFLKAGGAGLAKGIGKGLGKQVLKKIPLVGTLLSVWMGIDRWKKKDYLGAFIEFGSGIAAAFPGIGTLVSIGLDLVNLARDTGAIKAMNEKSKDITGMSMGENMLMNIPLIGPIYGTIKAIDLFKKGDKAAALKMAGKSLAAIIPGGAAIFDIFSALLGKKVEPESGGGSSKSGGIKWPWNKGEGDAPFGDAPIKWQNESGGYSSKGLTKGAKTAAENLNKFLGGGMTVTSAFRDPQKMMAEWKAATPIPGSKNRRNRWGNEMADPTKSNHAKGLAIDIPMSLYKHIGAGKFTGLAKKAGFSLVYPEKTAVHLEVPNNGKVAKASRSDIKDNKLAEPLAESGYQYMADNEDSQLAEIAGLSEAFSNYTDFFMGGAKDAIEGLSTGSAMPATPGLAPPSVDDLVSGTPAATTATATSVSAARASAPTNTIAPQQQVATTVMKQGSTPTMDTEIRDTDIALLNSILYQ